MSTSDATEEKVLNSSLNYKVACELGYELSNRDYDEMINYAKLVQKEFSKVTETSLRPKKQSTPLLESSLSDTHLQKSDRNQFVYFEDLWIKRLRECFENEING